MRNFPVDWLWFQSIHPKTEDDPSWKLNEAYVYMQDLIARGRNSDADASFRMTCSASLEGGEVKPSVSIVMNACFLYLSRLTKNETALYV